MPYLHRYPPGTGIHGYRTDLYQEVAVAVSRATALHLVSLGILKVAFEFHHENVKVCVSFEARAPFKQGKAAQRGFSVVHHVQELRWLTWSRQKDVKTPESHLERRCEQIKTSTADTSRGSIGLRVHTEAALLDGPQLLQPPVQRVDRLLHTLPLGHRHLAHTARHTTHAIYNDLTQEGSSEELVKTRVTLDFKVCQTQF